MILVNWSTPFLSWHFMSGSDNIFSDQFSHNQINTYEWKLYLSVIAFIKLCRATQDWPICITRQMQIFCRRIVIDLQLFGNIFILFLGIDSFFTYVLFWSKYWWRYKKLAITATLLFHPTYLYSLPIHLSISQKFLFRSNSCTLQDRGFTFSDSCVISVGALAGA